MSDPTTTPAAGGPLTDADHLAVAEAQRRGQKIRRAAAVAAFNGWVLATFAGLSALFVVFSAALGGLSASGLLVTVGLAALAWGEFRGRTRLLRFDPSGATLLGWNQVGLLALIVAYCAWSLYAGLSQPNAISQEIQANSELRAALGSGGEIDDLYKMLVVAVYGSVIALSVLFQGLNALYYFSRRKHVEAYLAETPDWVVALQRTTGAG